MVAKEIMARVPGTSAVTCQVHWSQVTAECRISLHRENLQAELPKVIIHRHKEVEVLGGEVWLQIKPGSFESF